MRKGKIGLFFISVHVIFSLIFLNIGTAMAKDVKIDILTSKMGGAGYVMCFALADIIEKNHPWISMRGIETTGIAENLKTLAIEPERRKNTVIFANPASAHQAKIADPPYKKPYGTLRLIALFNPARLFWVTLNPDIKTPKDLIGKKVGVFPRGSSGTIIFKALAEHGFGINLKDVDWVYVPLGPGINSIADRRLDATWALCSPPPLNTPVAPLQKLMVQKKKKVYFISFSEMAARAAREKTGYPIYVSSVPADTLSPGQPEFFGQIQFLSYCADLEMDEKIVYEITKTIYENVDKFAGYHALGKTMTKTSIAKAVNADVFHPGAIKFYNEKGIKIGME